MQRRLECSTEHTHTHASCLAIWWCLLHHLNVTHRGEKVGQTFSKVNHFLNAHKSQQLNPRFLFLSTHVPKEVSAPLVICS